MFMMFSPTLSVHVFPPSFVITIDQMRAGFQRIYNMMGDISIDVPQVDGVHHTFSLLLFGTLPQIKLLFQAYLVLERWVMRCRQSGIINDDVVRKVREGDY